VEYQSGNIFIRDMDSLRAPHEAGWRMEGHTHNFDHTTFICRGQYRCIRRAPIFDQGGIPITAADGSKALHEELNVIRGPGSALLIEAGKWHAFECLEGPGVLVCIYAHREPQSGDVVQRYNGWLDAYR
jgi:hypothetical protein